MITVIANNTKYTNFKSISLDMSLEKASRRFSLTAPSSSLDNLPIKTGDQIKILVDGEQRFFGYVERSSRSQTQGNDIFHLSGRSVTADMIDSRVDHRVQFSGRKSLRTVADTLFRYLMSQPLPQDDIEADPPPGFVSRADPLEFRVVVDEDIDDYLDDDLMEAEIGETYFEVLERFSKKRQVLLTTNGYGDLVFTRGRGGLATPFKIRNLRTNRSNNFLKEMEVVYDASHRYNTYDANSQPSKGAIRKISDITPDGLIIGDGRAIDDEIRISRKMFFIAESPSNAYECQNRATWEAIVARSRSVRYSVTLAGHSFKGNVWDSNISVDVLDEYANIEAKMLVNSVSFSETIDGGESTSLTCLPPNAFTFPEKPLEGKIGTPGETGRVYSYRPIGGWEGE